MGTLARMMRPILVVVSVGLCGSGSVVDSLGVPVRGAKVLRLPDTAYAITDRDGRWSFGGKITDTTGKGTNGGEYRGVVAASRLRVVVGGDRDVAGRRTGFASAAMMSLQPTSARGMVRADSIRIEAPGWQTVQVPYDSSSTRQRTVLKLDSSSGMVAVQGSYDSLGSEASGNNLPHVVRVGGFWIDTVEVTQAHFFRLMGFNPSHHVGCASCPVERVTWFDAVRFCNARSRAEQLPDVYDISDPDSMLWTWDPTSPGYRLPTEAEWEYATRAGSSSVWYWGPYINKETVSQYAWYDQNSGDSSHPVGLLKPNDLGLHDVAGNVAEWTNDWFEDLDGDSLTYPKGPSKVQEWKTVRGGDYSSQNTSVIASWRPPSHPTTRWISLGFRCVRGVMP